MKALNVWLKVIVVFNGRRRNHYCKNHFILKFIFWVPSFFLLIFFWSFWKKNPWFLSSRSVTKKCFFCSSFIFLSKTITHGNDMYRDTLFKIENIIKIYFSSMLSDYWSPSFLRFCSYYIVSTYEHPTWIQSTREVRVGVSDRVTL